jgi:hypothetical protein
MGSNKKHRIVADGRIDLSETMTSTTTDHPVTCPRDRAHRPSVRRLRLKSRDHFCSAEHGIGTGKWYTVKTLQTTPIWSACFSYVSLDKNLKSLNVGNSFFHRLLAIATFRILLVRLCIIVVYHVESHHCRHKIRC